MSSGCCYWCFCLDRWLPQLLPRSCAHSKPANVCIFAHFSCLIMLNTFALFAVVFLALLMHMCCHPVSCFVSSPQASLPRPNYFSIIFSYWGPILTLALTLLTSSSSSLDYIVSAWQLPWLYGCLLPLLVITHSCLAKCASKLCIAAAAGAAAAKKPKATNTRFSTSHKHSCCCIISRSYSNGSSCSGTSDRLCAVLHMKCRLNNRKFAEQTR